MGARPGSRALAKRRVRAGDRGGCCRRCRAGGARRARIAEPRLDGRTRRGCPRRRGRARARVAAGALVAPPGRGRRGGQPLRPLPGTRHRRTVARRTALALARGAARGLASRRRRVGCGERGPRGHAWPGGRRGVGAGRGRTHGCRAARGAVRGGRFCSGWRRCRPEQRHARTTSTMPGPGGRPIRPTGRPRRRPNYATSPSSPVRARRNASSAGPARARPRDAAAAPAEPRLQRPRRRKCEGDGAVGLRRPRRSRN